MRNMISNDWHRLWRDAVSLLIAFAVLPAVGCGDGLGGEIAVTGKVTFGGKPVDAGIIFFSADKSGAGFRAPMQKDGSYQLTLLHVKPGDTFKIFFTPREISPGEPAKVDGSGIPIPAEPQIPSKYFDAEASGLTAKIAEIAPQTLDFVLSE
ncbi:MAG: hypothetical protein LC104_03180 [Bacteroidales bacterium]|nr:hypothetical protein [Bacteroidales bacterium]